MESLNHAIEDARARYVSANPLSMAADKSAEQYLPGGNTRTVFAGIKSAYDPAELLQSAEGRIGPQGPVGAGPLPALQCAVQLSLYL